MTTVTASRRDTPAGALAAVTAFGLLLGWATYTLYGTQGDRRAVAGAAVTMVVLGEGLWLGVKLHYWGEATVFLAVGALLTAGLSAYLARAGVRRWWLCAVLAPLFAGAFYLAEFFVLDRLIGAF
ncbi:hypothetical protein ACWDU0_06920 [Streptomyces cellulosae]